MTHDELCPAPYCDDECMGYEDCDHHCRCPLIARVREDERAAIRERVEAGRRAGALEATEAILAAIDEEKR